MTSRKAMARHTSVPLLPGSEDDFKPLTVHICTSAQAFNVQGLIDEIKSRFPRHLVDRVEYIELPYNDVDKFTFGGMDAVVLCHSIHNRRFAITNVMDALYDKFLKNAEANKNKKSGIRMVGVIVHDIPDDRVLTEKRYQTEMEAFRCRQPTTFECADLVMMAGKLDVAQVGLLEERWEELEVALQKAKQHRPVLPAWPVLQAWPAAMAAVLLNGPIPCSLWMCLCLFVMFIANILDIFYDATSIEIVLDVVRIALLGVTQVIAAITLRIVNQALKEIFFQVTLLSLLEIVVVPVSLLLIDEQDWKYVYIVLVPLPLLLVAWNGKILYRHCSDVNKEVIVQALVCSVVAYGLLIWGFYDYQPTELKERQHEPTTAMRYNDTNEEIQLNF